MYKENTNFISSPTSGNIPISTSPYIIGHWKGITASTSGINLLDYSLNANNLPSFRTGGISSTFLTTGKANYIDVSVPDKFFKTSLTTEYQFGMTNGDSVVFSFRYKRNNLPNAQATLLLLGGNEYSKYILVYLTTAGYLTTGVYNGTDGLLTHLQHTASTCNNVEHHAVIVLRFSTLAYSGEMYIDGKIVDTVTNQAMTVNTTVPSTAVHIGASFLHTSPFAVTGASAPTVNYLYDLQIGAKNNIGSKWRNLVPFLTANPLTTIPAEIF